ncbi:hypothetical protein SSX86_022837 [Deinandra increscens subsp. villosa]|uniref:BED-type domain-containing protein n=1 Tax=Deinandra increscens subsp. villosa TaxID=3103831 RepID=A0AAP0CPY2_9ASTR
MQPTQRNANQPTYKEATTRNIADRCNHPAHVIEVTIPDTPPLVPTRMKKLALIGEVNDIHMIYNAELVLAIDCYIHVEVHYIGGKSLVIIFNTSVMASDFLNNHKENWSKDVFDVTSATCYVLTEKIERIEATINLKWSDQVFKVWVCENTAEWTPPSIPSPTGSKDPASIAGSEDDDSDIGSNYSLYNDDESFADTITGIGKFTPTIISEFPGSKKTKSGSGIPTPSPAAVAGVHQRSSSILKRSPTVSPGHVNSKVLYPMQTLSPRAAHNMAGKVKNWLQTPEKSNDMSSLGTTIAADTPSAQKNNLKCQTQPQARAPSPKNISQPKNNSPLSLAQTKFQCEFESVDAFVRSDGLLSIWDPDKFSMTTVHKHRNYILITGNLKSPNQTLTVINIYGPHDLNSKVALWSDLSDRLSDNPGTSVILLGDFNESGGLGIGSLRAANLALLSKWGWRFKVDKGALWRKTISSIHSSKRLHGVITVKKNIRGCWKQINEALKELESLNIEFWNEIRVTAGKGADLLFWHDNWASDKPLMRLFPSLYELGKDKSCSVEDRWPLNPGIDGFAPNWKWKRRPSRPVESSELNSLIPLITSVQRTNSEDKWMELEDISSDNMEYEEGRDHTEDEGDDLSKEKSAGKRPPKRKYKPRKKKAVAWIYSTQFKDTDGKEKGKCMYCGENICCNTDTHGTSGLNKHLRRWRDNPANKEKQAEICVEQNEEGQSTLKTWKFDPAKVRKALIEMVIECELSFSFIERNGFRKFIQTLCPSVKIPSRFTVARDIVDYYLEEKKKLKFVFIKSKPRVSFTTDTWTSNQRINYMCLTAHFIDYEWNFHKKIISFKPILSHKGDAIATVIEECLIEWGIENVMSFTLDNASSNDVAVRELGSRLPGLLRNGRYLHVRCLAHIINLIVQDGLKAENDTIDCIRNAVKFVRQSPSRLATFKACVREKGIKSKSLLSLDVCTRWNSTCEMLERAAMFDKAFELYAVREKDFRKTLDVVPDFMHWRYAKKVVEILELFKGKTTEVSCSTYAIAHEYYAQVMDISHNLEEMSKNCDQVFNLKHTIKLMRSKFAKYFEDTGKSNQIFEFAFILDPRFKLELIEYAFKKEVQLITKPDEDMTDEEYKTMWRISWRKWLMM